MSWKNYIFPQVCCFCKIEPAKDELYLCETCLQQLVYTPTNCCPQCAAPLDTILELCHQCLESTRLWRQGLSPLQFTGQSRELIHHFKYNSQLTLSRFLVDCMQKTLLQNAKIPDCICYVPMHWFKQWQRGYNQAQILAQELSKKINCPLKPLLKRRHWTGAQALMSRTQRQENIRHIFEFNTKEKMPKGTILIVDDVLTTGATLTACCKALINSGAKDICILTAARG